MSEKSETTVIGSLPHSRPQRRSDKRAARPTQAQAGTASAAAQPKAKPAQPAPEPPLEQGAPAGDETRPNCPSSLPDGAELIGTVVKATFELAEIGMTVAARALRTAVSGFPRP